MSLVKRPDVFHVAVAGAPVTSWDGYDSHYTERYMGMPSDNPSGYENGLNNNPLLCFLENIFLWELKIFFFVCFNNRCYYGACE